MVTRQTAGAVRGDTQHTGKCSSSPQEEERGKEPLTVQELVSGAPRGDGVAASDPGWGCAPAACFTLAA